MIGKDIITIKEMLAHIQSGRPFSCVYVTYDRKRKTGGERRDISECKLVQHDRPPHLAAAQRRNTKTEQMQMLLDSSKRNPNHHEWYTRNVVIMQAGKPTSIIKKLHPPLVIEFNGKIVVP